MKRTIATGQILACRQVNLKPRPYFSETMLPLGGGIRRGRRRFAVETPFTSPRSFWSIFSRSNTASTTDPKDSATTTSTTTTSTTTTTPPRNDMSMPARQTTPTFTSPSPSSSSSSFHSPTLNSHNNNNNNNNGNNRSNSKKKSHTGSSFTDNGTNNSASAGILNQEVKSLLDSPMGSMDATQWTLATKYIVKALEEQPNDLPLAFRLLDRMAEEPDSKNNNHKLTNDTVYMVLQHWLTAYAKHQKSSQEFNRHLYPPSTVWRKVEAYLRAGISLESRTCHLILEGTALVKSRKANSPQLAETILEKMMSLSRHANPEIRPTTTTFNLVIAAWEAAAANAPPTSEMVQQEAPQRAMALLQQIKTLYASGWGDSLMPSRFTYRGVMNLYAHKGDGDQVEELLQELYEMYLDHGRRETLFPTSSYFSLVLYAWSKSNDPDAADRALTLLDSFLELEQSREIPHFSVTAPFFNICMVCLSRRKTRESATEVQALFDKMVALSLSDPTKKPVAGSYAALIHSWSWWDPREAENAFWTWKREHSAGNCDMRVDGKLYTSLMGSWFRSKDPESAQRCDRLLQYALEGNLGDAWEPTVAAFNMTINAYCQTKKIEHIERAEGLLRQMDSLATATADSKVEFAGPSMFSYVPIIHALTQMGRVEHAEKLLREWFDRSSKKRISDEDAESGSKKSQLDTKTVNHVLRAWLSKAPLHPEAADRAEDLLLSMSTWGLKPNRASFQHVLECRKRVGKDWRGQPKTKSRADEVVALLDLEYITGRLGTDNTSYLQLRQGWSLLTI